MHCCYSKLRDYCWGGAEILQNSLDSVIQLSSFDDDFSLVSVFYVMCENKLYTVGQKLHHFIFAVSLSKRFTVKQNNYWHMYIYSNKAGTKRHQNSSISFEAYLYSDLRNAECVLVFVTNVTLA